MDYNVKNKPSEHVSNNSRKMSASCGGGETLNSLKLRTAAKGGELNNLPEKGTNKKKKRYDGRSVVLAPHIKRGERRWWG